MGISRESQETREFRPYYGERPDAADEGIGVGGVAPALDHRRDLIGPLRPRLLQLLPRQERFGRPHEMEP